MGSFRIFHDITDVLLGIMQHTDLVKPCKKSVPRHKKRHANMERRREELKDHQEETLAADKQEKKG